MTACITKSPSHHIDKMDENIAYKETVLWTLVIPKFLFLRNDDLCSVRVD